MAGLLPPDLVINRERFLLGEIYCTPPGGKHGTENPGTRIEAPRAAAALPPPAHDRVGDDDSRGALLCLFNGDLRGVPGYRFILDRCNHNVAKAIFRMFFCFWWWKTTREGMRVRIVLDL